MKQYLAVFIGKEATMIKWNQLSEAERKEREQKGMAAWNQWVQTHAKAIVHMGSPLGKTKRISNDGIADFKNEICAYTVVQAENQEDAARMFLNHPHFALFPGDSVEVIESLPIPGRD